MKIKLVFRGDTFGREHCVTHKDSEPLVEFYDARFTDGFEPEGQFITRYSLSMLDGTNRWCRGGSISGRTLCLQSDIPNWTVDGINTAKIMTWIDGLLLEGATYDEP